MLLFAFSTTALLFFTYWNTRRTLDDQTDQIIEAEITGLSEQYRLGGIRRLVIAVDARARRPGSSLYLVTTFTGQPLAGNVTALPPGVLDEPGWIETTYRRIDEAEQGPQRPVRPVHLALVRVFQLPGGFRLLEYLMRHAGQVVTRTMLLESVWEYHFDPQTNVIDVHISRLRAKIDKGFQAPLLHTVRGAGYMIRAH